MKTMVIRDDDRIWRFLGELQALQDLELLSDEDVDLILRTNHPKIQVMISGDDTILTIKEEV
jgi:hypothetical protein